MSLFSIEPDAFGIDISDFSLKICRLEKRGNSLHLAAFGTTPLATGIVQNGIVQDPKKLATTIKSAINNIEFGSINTPYVVCSISEQNAFLRVVQLPKMTTEEARSAVLHEAENHIPLPIAEAYLDSVPIPPADPQQTLDHLDMFVAALPKKVVDPYLTSLDKAGLVPRIIEIESIATARAVVPGPTSISPILIVDLGANRTGVTIFAGTSVRFSTTISVSAQLLTDSIVRNRNMRSRERAEKLKLKYGIAAAVGAAKRKKKDGTKIRFSKKRTEEEQEVTDALMPPLIDLAEQIRRYSSYYTEHATHEHAGGHAHIEKVIVTGGGSRLKGLHEFLQQQLNLPVETANPWVNILPASMAGTAELPPDVSLSYATALGLALRGVESSHEKIIV